MRHSQDIHRSYDVIYGTRAQQHTGKSVLLYCHYILEYHRYSSRIFDLYDYLLFLLFLLDLANIRSEQLFGTSLEKYRMWECAYGILLDVHDLPGTYAYFIHLSVQ